MTRTKPNPIAIACGAIVVAVPGLALARGKAPVVGELEEITVTARQAVQDARLTGRFAFTGSIDRVEFDLATRRQEVGAWRPSDRSRRGEPAAERELQGIADPRRRPAAGTLAGTGSVPNEAPTIAWR